VNIFVRPLFRPAQRIANDAGVTRNHEHCRKHNQIFHRNLLSRVILDFTGARRSSRLGFSCANIATQVLGGSDINGGPALPLGVSEALPDNDETNCRQGDWADDDQVIDNAPL
jgi:uncharacterized protein (DUF2342 family)